MRGQRPPPGSPRLRSGRYVGFVVATDLSGNWRLAEADDELRRAFINDDFDDGDWRAAQVPGQWQLDPALAAAQGSMLYRRMLDTETPDDGSRSWLMFDGVHYASDVWFDGEYLGATEGYFVPHQFEVTEAVAEQRNHVVAVEVLSRRTDEDEARRSVTGILDDTEVVGEHFNAGGIWRPVRLVTTGPVRMSKLRVLCTSATNEKAQLRLRCYLDSDAARDISVTTTLLAPGGAAPINHRRTHHVATGDTVLEWEVTVDQPKLWWPHTLGDSPIYRLQVAVEADGSAGTSDLHETSIGLRTVDMRNFHLHVNGVRLFTKGANLWPTKAHLSTVSVADSTLDVSLAKQLGLDLLRVQGHIAAPSLYDAADRAGVLLWQDFPLQGRYARSVNDSAVAQAYRMVDLLGHHPSIAIWCGHDDPTGTSRVPDADSRPRRPSLRRLVLQEAPTWNKSVLDRNVARAIEKADPTRPVIQHSGCWPSPPRFDGTDTHLWFGWLGGTGRDLDELARRVPRLVRWVSAFGAQSIPHDLPGVDERVWPPEPGQLQALGWNRHGFDQFVPAADHRSFESWQVASQNYQATLLRRQIETLRRLKYRPAGGFSFSALSDCRPAVSFAVLDHERTPKIAFRAVKAACAPTIVVADRLPVELSDGAALALDVHVVNDRREPLTEHLTTATLHWPDGGHEWRWRGGVPADDVIRVGTINWVVPRGSPGPVRLEVKLENPAGEVVASNAYDARLL